MKTYCNIDLLLEHFTEEEIAVLPRISSWAINPGPENDLKKREIGLKVKRILDYGRLAFIE